jgi:hypothetical protein
VTLGGGRRLAWRCALLVEAAARARLLSLVADSLAAAGNPRLALHAIDTAISLANSSGPGARAPSSDLLAQRERLRAAARR